MSKPRYEVYEDKGGEWRWRLVAGNGEIVAASEAYANRASAERGVADAASASVGASEVDVGDASISVTVDSDDDA